MLEQLLNFTFSLFTFVLQMEKTLKSEQTSLLRKPSAWLLVRAQYKISKKNTWTHQRKSTNHPPMDTRLILHVSDRNAKSKTFLRFLLSSQQTIVCRYEETYFTRLPTTKEDRHKFRQKYSSTSFANEIAGVGSSRSDTSGKRKGDKGKKKGMSNHTIVFNSFSFRKCFTGFKKRRKF